MPGESLGKSRYKIPAYLMNRDYVANDIPLAYDTDHMSSIFKPAFNLLVNKLILLQEFY